MSPEYDWTNSTSSTDATLSTTAGDSLLFTDLDTTIGWKAITYDSAASAPYQVQKAFNLYELGVPRTNGNEFIITSQDGPENFDNITNINTCVKANLGSDSKWAHYFYKGSIWINTDDLTPQEQNDTIIGLSKTGILGNITVNTLLKGSVGLSNITLETYTQTFESFDTTIFDIHNLKENQIGNCFGCHSATYSVKPYDTTYTSMIYISHLFNGYLGRLKGKTDEEARKERVNEIKQMVRSIK